MGGATGSATAPVARRCRSPFLLLHSSHSPPPEVCCPQAHCRRNSERGAGDRGAGVAILVAVFSLIAVDPLLSTLLSRLISLVLDAGFDRLLDRFLRLGIEARGGSGGLGGAGDPFFDSVVRQVQDLIPHRLR